MIRKRRFGKRGFSLTELLIIVAVICVLAAVVVFSANAARTKMRDSRRMADMKAISDALAMRQVHNGVYPLAVAPQTIDGSTDILSTILPAEGLIERVPVDPLTGIDPVYVYTYQTPVDGSSYTLTFCLETDDFDRYGRVKGCDPDKNRMTP